jgi:hypothetical protein
MAIVEQRHLLAADPRHHAADEAVALGHDQQQIQYAAGHEAEVAGVGRDGHVGQAADQLVEGGSRCALEQALAVALATLSVDHVGALVDQRHHVRQEFGRVLQIGVDDQDALTAAHREAGGERQLVAVVAHQLHRDDARVAGRRLGHDLPGAVARAVVDQDDLAGAARAVQHGADAAQELGQGFLLIVARGHHGQRRAVGGAHAGEH